MAISLGDVVVNIAEEAGNKLANEAVIIAKGNAPVDSGNLRGSIHAEKTGDARWKITTNAVGENDFAYPARIEKGEEVLPNPMTNPKGVIWFHGKYHKKARASNEKEFMLRTMNSLHI